MPCFSTAFRALALSALAAFGLGPACAQTAPAPAPPEIVARSYLLLDVTANQLLAQKDIDKPVEPASLTKLMSAYLVFDALKSRKITLQQTFPVSTKAWKMPGPRMSIDPKMQVPVEDLLKGMIVQSGNDATMALAEGVGGSSDRFVQLMNDQAKVLGLKNTSYKNPEGLAEPGHTSTARDLAVLANRLIQDFPEYIGYYAIKQYRYPGTLATNGNNRNLLLFRDPTVDGLQTGHSDAAGYCLVATAHRDVPGVGTRRLLAILLGTASENARANEGQKLLNWGYTAFEAVKLFDAGQAVASPPVWKGAQNTLPLGQPGAIVVAVPAGTSGQVKTEVSRPDPLVAPFAKGQKVGELRITAGDQPPMEVPLMALQEVPQAGMLGRAWDSIRLWIR